MAHRTHHRHNPCDDSRVRHCVLSVAIAVGLGFFVLRHFEAVLTPFLFAVAATVWYAGTRQVCSQLSFQSSAYYFFEGENGRRRSN